MSGSCFCESVWEGLIGKVKHWYFDVDVQEERKLKLRLDTSAIVTDEYKKTTLPASLVALQNQNTIHHGMPLRVCIPAVACKGYTQADGLDRRLVPDGWLAAT